MKSFEDAMLEVKASDRKCYLAYDKRVSSSSFKRSGALGTLFSTKENQKIDINSSYIEYMRSFK